MRVRDRGSLPITIRCGRAAPFGPILPSQRGELSCELKRAGARERARLSGQAVPRIENGQDAGLPAAPKREQESFGD